MPKMSLKSKKMAKFRNFCFHRFSGSKLPKQMVLAIFTRCLVPELCILSDFGVKSAFLGPNFSRTEIFTTKPMVVGYVQHYSRHFVKVLGKSLESFFPSPKNCQKWQKMAKNADFSKISNC